MLVLPHLERLLLEVNITDRLDRTQHAHADQPHPDGRRITRRDKGHIRALLGHRMHQIIEALEVHLRSRRHHDVIVVVHLLGRVVQHPRDPADGRRVLLNHTTHCAMLRDRECRRCRAVRVYEHAHFEIIEPETPRTRPRTVELMRQDRTLYQRQIKQTPTDPPGQRGGAHRTV